MDTEIVHEDPEINDIVRSLRLLTSNEIILVYCRSVGSKPWVNQTSNAVYGR